MSEAIRRSVLAQRDRVLGVPPTSQRERRAALSRLFELFRGNDPNGEIRKLKADDAGF